MPFGKIDKFVNKAQKDGIENAVGLSLWHLFSPLISLYKYRIHPYITHLKYRHRFRAAVPKPWEILHISPEDIEYILTPPFFKGEYAYSGINVIGGDWDSLDEGRRIDVARDGFEERVKIPFTTEHWGWFHSIKQYFMDDIPWSRTTAYEYYKSEYSIERAEAMRLRLDNLYESIKSEGYKTPTELAMSNPAYPSGINHPNLNMIIVNIGREGEFIFEDGKNRVCLAKVMNLDSVPVRVLGRHKRWQSIREKVATAEKPEDLSSSIYEFLDHPDIQNISPESW